MCRSNEFCCNYFFNTINFQRQELDISDEDIADGEDEKPVVVVLRDGDLTAEEAAQLQSGENIKGEGRNLQWVDGQLLYLSRGLEF